ncbi:MAG: hypothetical protein AAF299_15180 [Pseudomonadota bacterium]
MFGVVELCPVGQGHPLPGDSISAYSQVVVIASNDEEFRKIIETYFESQSLRIGAIDDIRHICDLSEVSADHTLIENVASGWLQEHKIATGSFNCFHSEGEA